MIQLFVSKDVYCSVTPPGNLVYMTHNNLWIILLYFKINGYFCDIK
jgi:hypothetical protein